MFYALANRSLRLLLALRTRAKNTPLIPPIATDKASINGSLGET